MTAGTHLAGAALTASLLRGFGVEVGLLEGLALAPGIGPASRPACGRPAWPRSACGGGSPGPRRPSSSAPPWRAGWPR
jgi:hypothetical protein